ncbi:MAG TPA: dihydrodipicolinate reductase C-terminal domain-containing protein [Thermoanaerobaculia bacterium]|nr:dihydrodipicolinate reductase C-terminal domain-containing protein [Thermoanaerobaculia bacterium]
MKRRVCIAGITGWVGRPLADAVTAADDLELAAGVARRAAGETLHGAAILASVPEALAKPFDVLVDYTSAEAVKANVLAAIAARRHVVVGSSGLSDDDFEEIGHRARANGVGVIAVGNFAISAALLGRFAAEAAKHFPAWEIIDFAHDTKVDAPSGTAREIAWRLGRAGSPRPAVSVGKSVGPRESRGANISGTQVHSLRVPGNTIAVEVHFGRDDERLTLRYEGGAGAAPYIAGTLLAIRRVPAVTGVMRGLDAVL